MTRELQRLIPSFSGPERREHGCWHQLFFSQVEYCDNLIFRRRARLDQLNAHLASAHNDSNSIEHSPCIAAGVAISSTNIGLRVFRRRWELRPADSSARYSPAADDARRNTHRVPGKFNSPTADCQNESGNLFPVVGCYESHSVGAVTARLTRE